MAKSHKDPIRPKLATRVFTKLTKGNLEELNKSHNYAQKKNYIRKGSGFEFSVVALLAKDDNDNEPNVDRIFIRVS